MAMVTSMAGVMVLVVLRARGLVWAMVSVLIASMVLAMVLAPSMA